MGDFKPPCGCENSDNWEKVGEIRFVSSLSATPAFSSGRAQIIYSSILPTGEVNHVPFNERVNATIWGCKNQ